MSQKYREAGFKDGDIEAQRRSVEADFSKSPSLTVQAPAEETDINKIMKRVMKGQSVIVNNGQPFYGDVSDLGGLQEAFMKVQEAEDLFMQYPADVRERFENDPIQLVEFLENPNNRAEAEKLGLVNKAPVPEPAKTPPTPPAPAAGAGTTQ